MSFIDTYAVISAFLRTGRSPFPVYVVLRPFISLSFFHICFLFRFPLHIFIRRSFLTINANHLHVGSSRRSEIPSSQSGRRRASSTPSYPRRDKPPLGICDCLDLYACTDVGRGRVHDRLVVARKHPRVDRSILGQTVNIADELVQSASTGIWGRGRTIWGKVRGYAYPAICRVAEILCRLMPDANPADPPLVVPHFFSNVSRVFSVPRRKSGACFGNVEGN